MDLSPILARFDAAWHANGRPADHRLRPGLTDAEIDALMAPTGLDLPDELRQWWRWHDGSVDTSDESKFPCELSPAGWLHLSLEQALQSWDYAYSNYQSHVATGFTDVSSLIWREGLFPISRRTMAPNHLIAIDTTADGTGFLIFLTEMGIRPDTPPVSFAEAVGTWVDFRESRDYDFDGADWNVTNPEPYFLDVLRRDLV